MKIGRILIVLSLCLFLPIFVYAQIKFPQYTGYVNDFENILNNDEVLNQKLIDFEKETTVEVAIVTVPDFSGTTLEDYAVKLFENWKIGKADIDNGLLILVSSAQKQARIEAGYGLEGTLPDSLAGRVQDEYMIPAFREGDYSKGVSDSVDVLIGIIKEDPTVISSLNTKKESSANVPEIILMALFFGFYLMAASKSWWLGGVLGFIIGTYFAFTNGIYILPFITTPLGLLIDFILSKTPLGHIVMSGLHHSSSSGSSGGGMSFGGGSSGGGGSSRSW
jgi:uncharacterized protein